MATNPTLLTMPIAENGQKNTIPATQAAAGDGLLSQSTGFPPETALPLGAGGKAPTREDFNGAFNLLSNIAFYAQKGWMFNFDAGQSYFAGCIVRDTTDGKLYECLNDVAAGGSVPSADTTNWKVFSTGGGVPVGFILPYAAEGLEEGFLECDGSAVSRTMYPDLFAKLGTKWGAGDGSTTFNLPRSEDLVLQGASATNPVGTYKQAGLPNIEGKFALFTYSGSGYLPFQDLDGAFSSNAAGTSSVLGTSNAYSSDAIIAQFDASDSNAIYGASDTVQSPAACVRYMIKAFDGPTPSSAGIDLTQYAQDLANRLTREQTPAFNHRDVITTSGTYTAPVDGWYKITVKGGGGGGGGSYYSSNEYFAGGGGGEGGTTIAYERMTAGDTASVVIGAGGTGGAANGGNGTDGGDSSASVNSNTYTGGGGKHGEKRTNGAGGTGTIIGVAGGVGSSASSSANVGGEGGGNGGGVSVFSAVGSNGTQGGGGCGGSIQSTGGVAGSNGGDGFVWFEYFAAV